MCRRGNGQIGQIQRNFLVIIMGMNCNTITLSTQVMISSLFLFASDLIMFILSIRSILTAFILSIVNFILLCQKTFVLVFRFDFTDSISALTPE
jgi:hypothetical protein